MTYATLADMQARFETDELIQLTDQTMTGAVAEVAIATVLTEADNLINSYLSLYTLPLSTVPPILVDYACDIARYRLHKTRPPEQVETRYRDALAWLKLLSGGTVKLDASGTATAALLADTIEFDGPERVFSRQSLRGF